MSDIDEADDMLGPLGNDGFDQVLLQAMLAQKPGGVNGFECFADQDEEEEENLEEIMADPHKKILWAAENNRRDTVLELLQGDNSLVQSIDEDGYSPLHRAAYNGHTDMVSLLIEHGADIQAKTADGWSPLHSAARWNQARVAALLLQHQANINAQTNSGQTPLHIAASNRDCRNCIEILLTHPQVDISLKNNLCETAYDICQRTSESCLLFELKEECVTTIK